MPDCIFCKIASKTIPASLVYEDDTLMVFNDIHPQKPVHLLVVPKKHIPEFQAIEDPTLFKDIAEVIQKIIKEKHLTTGGHKIVINGGGAQDVDHLHIHVMGPIDRGK